MATNERHVVVVVARRGNGEQPDRPATDDHDPFPRLQPGASDPVPRDAGGLDETGVAHVQTRGQWDEAVIRYEQPVREPAVAVDADVAPAAGAPVGIPRTAFR